MSAETANSQTCDLRQFATSVKNQGSCGSCWAFGTMAAAEGAHFLWAQTDTNGAYSPNVLSQPKYKDSWQLAEQILVDCCGANYDSNGCGGGGASGPMQCAVDIAALPSTASHPYTATDKHNCTYSRTQANAFMSSWYQPCAFGDEVCLQQLIGGPSCSSFFTTAIKTSIEVISSFYDYVDGVYSDPACPNTIHNHAVAIVGWGTQVSSTGSNKDYWILRNSWGTSLKV